MKIKGTHRNKTPHPKTGKKYGDPIEFTPEEKVPLAVMDALKKEAAKGEIHIVKNKADVTIDAESMKTVSKGTPTKGERSPASKGFANNSYQAAGTVKFHRHVSEADRLMAAKTKQYKIEFEDVLDDWGQPELNVTSFSLT